MSHAGRGDAVAMPWRWSWVLSGLVIMVIAVILGMAWVVASRRHRSVMDRVDREIAAGRYGAARQHLSELTTRWMRPDEFDYRLGLCEGHLGHDEAALAAWGRLPPKSAYAEAAALNSAAVEMNRGHSSAAEAILQVR